MPRILLTAFEPFSRFAENSSRLCLYALERDPPPGIELVTRVYPVAFDPVRQALEQDLASGVAASLHLGQSGRGDRVSLEMFSLNVGAELQQDALEHRTLEPLGPAAYRSPLPLAQWAAELQAQGLPVEVSHHAGTYLCNATSYWAHHWNQRQERAIRSLFVHVPLAIEQGETPALSLDSIVSSVRGVLERLARTI
jgi:pyroglutamyl-peptidase